ncbi:MAG: hypothetical protein JWR07_754, partial [Nevskia sp.]|nr:hypothetical protein [Nevskia sp.]
MSRAAFFRQKRRITSSTRVKDG